MQALVEYVQVQIESATLLDVLTIWTSVNSPFLTVIYTIILSKRDVAWLSESCCQPARAS